MIDATVAPKVGFISPFGTTVCNVNHINACGEPRPMAGATQERKLLDVGSTAGFGGGCWSLCVLWGKVDFDGRVITESHFP